MKRKPGKCKKCGEEGHYSTTCKANYCLIVKECRSCDKELLLSNFQTNLSYCNECMKERTVEWRAMTKAKNLASKEHDLSKFCTSCNKEKSWTKFVLNPNVKGGLNPYCKTCVNSSYHACKHNYKNSAKTRGIEWTLADADVRKLHKDLCFYCGDSSQRLFIKRLDVDKGYTKDNVVKACKVCNSLLKHNVLGLESLHEKLKQMVRNLNKKSGV